MRDPTPDTTTTDVQVLGQSQTLSSRALLVRKASARIPTTAEGLPVGFYRVDLLPHDLELTPEAQEQVQLDTESTEPTEQTKQTPEQIVQAQLKEVESLKAAYVELDYEHSYPTLPNGEPFWHKLDFEPGIAYAALQMYLEANQEGPRTLDQVASSQELIQVLSAANGRPQDKPYTTTEVLRTLEEFFILYQWRHRAKAYDLFHEAAYRHTRMRRAMSMEEHHYKTAERLLQRVVNYMDTEDFSNKLGPKSAIDAFKALVGVQRTSVGLPSSGPLPTKDQQGISQFEAILRQIGTQQASSGPQEQRPGRTKMLDDLLKNPDTIKNMQELVIRVTTTNFADDRPNQPGHPNQQPNPGMSAPLDGESYVVPEEDIDFHKSVSAR
jgi:hypothetical protein